MVQSDSASEAMRDLRTAKYYVIGAVAIGVMEIVDAAILVEHQGTNLPISYLIAIVEFLWVIFSVIALIRVKHRGTKLLAGVFVGYNVLGWVIGAAIGAVRVVPIGLAIAGGVFGLAYAVASAYLARAIANGSRGAA